MIDKKDYKLIEIIDKKNEYIITVLKEDVANNKKEISALKDSCLTNYGNTKDLIKENQEDIDAKIEVVEARMDNKIYLVDKILKGEDKQGLVDQVRFLKLGMSIISVVLILALGGQVYGLNIKDIVNSIFGSTETTEINVRQINIETETTNKEIEK